MNAIKITIAALFLSLVACEREPAPPAPLPGAKAPAVAGDGSAVPPAPAAQLPRSVPDLDEEAPPAGPPAKLNLNTASGDEFRAIPNVTDRMVHEFEEYRPYVSIAQFRREIGKYVSAEQVAEYEKYLFVPIAPDDCDAATLQQIPGVTAELAEQLIASRPFGSNEAFLKSVSPYLDAAQLAVAESYLAAPTP